MAGAFDDIPARGAADPFGDIVGKPKLGADSPFADVKDSGPDPFNLRTGFVEPETAGTLKRAGKAVVESPATAIPGAAEALTSGIGAMGGAAAGGVSGLAEGLASFLSGKGFMPGFEAGKSESERRQKKSAPLFDPTTDVGRALTAILGIPSAEVSGRSEKVFEKTGSPAAAAAMEAGGNLAAMALPGARREAIERPPAIRPPQPVPTQAPVAPAPVAPPAQAALPKIEAPAAPPGPLSEPRPATPTEAPLPALGKRLTQRLIELGGINKAEASDTFGETGMRAARSRPGLFQTSERVSAATRRGNSLSTLVHDGQLDDYLPPELRQQTGIDRSERVDEAVDWLRERIQQDLATKDVGTYETMMERQMARGAWEQHRGQPIDSAADPFEGAFEVGVEPTTANMIDAAKIDRAREMDPSAVERIPDQADDATYMQHIERIINAQRTDQEPVAPVGLAAEPPQGAPEAGGAVPSGTAPAPAVVEPPLVPMQPRAQRGGPPAPVPAEPEPISLERLASSGGRPKPNALADSVRRVFAPATRGPAAERTAGIMRQNAAQLARDTQVAQLRLEKFGSLVDKLPEAERYGFIDAIEGGREQANPKLQPVADEMRAMLDERRVAVQQLGIGALTSFIEDYFPHIWKDPTKASAAMEQIARAEFSKRPLTGPGSFLKQRTIPTVRQGLEYGLEPVTSNPIDLTLLKIREMDRFIMGTRVMQEMKATGMAQFVRFGESAPEAWRRIDDKSARVLQWDEQAQGFIERGHYYAPEESARIINNYLKPGLAGDPLYDTVRGAGNLLNLAQLGFSAFHLGFTTMDAMVSKTALGLEQLARGELVKGGTNVAKGMLVSEAAANVWRGEKLHRAYMNPGTGGPLMESIVDGLVKGGGRVRMDQFYNATRGGSYWNSIANQRFLHELTKNGVARGVAEFFPRLVQTISAPIMEYIVPRQKLGVFSDLMKAALEKEPHMGPERMRVVAGKIWDSVDNRLGELVYDNLFWNKVIKDLAFVSVRSVGWNLGTIREIGGGALEYGKAAADVARGKAPDFTHKMAYVAALPIVAGLYGAILQYLYTGQGPKEAKDMYFPKTGRITKEGYPERLSPPTYMKDIVEYYHAPGQTVVNKMNPLVSTMAQMYRNEDFFGAQIRDQDADALKQSEQVIRYLTRQLMPFSYRGFQRQKEEGAPPEASALSFFGLNPAPAFITRPPEVNRELERRRDLPAIRKRLRQEAKDAAP